MRSYQTRLRWRLAAGVSATALAAVMSLASSSAMAQATDSGAGQIEEIVVTSQRREQRLQDVPAAVSVVGGGDLKAAGAVSTRDIQNFAPNVDITRIQSNSNPRIFIRGVGSSDSFAGGNPAVSTYVDDVVIGSISGNTFGLYDLERVEVLRGPQGTLYGRNATAGAINYISRQPTYDRNGYATIGYGNFNKVTLEGSVNQPLIDDTLTLRVSGTYQERDGTVRNTVTGSKNLGDDLFWGARGILRYNPTPDLDIRLNIHAGESRPHSVPWKALASRTPGNTAVSCSRDLLAAGGCVDTAGRSFAGSYDPDIASLNYPGLEKLGSTGTNLRVEYTLPFATLTSITAYDRYTRKVKQDLDGSANTVQHYFFNWDTDTFSQEFRLTSRNSERFKWVVGAFLYRFDTDALAYSTQTGLPAPTFNDYSQKTKSEAVFGHFDFKVVDKLTLTGGLRYTNERSNARESAYYFTVPTTTVYANYPQHLKNDNVSGELGLNYQVAPDVMVYANYARGFRAGTINSAPVFQTAQVNAINPELLTSYEGGLKSQFFDRRVQLNLAAFLYDYEDMQVSNFLNIGGRAVTVTANAATAKIHGFEAEALFAVNRELTLKASGGYLPEAKFDEYVIPNVATYSGKRLPNSPKWTGNFGADYHHPMDNGLQLDATVNAAVHSMLFFTSANDVNASRPKYWDVSGRIGVSTADEKWAVSLWGKNLTDSRHVVYVTDFSSLFGFYVRSFADPRTFGAELTYRF